jgi:ferredoxin
MKIMVDRANCQGHAMCQANAPEVYKLDDLGYTSLENGTEVSATLREQAERGAEACPERVFTVVD